MFILELVWNFLIIGKIHKNMRTLTNWQQKLLEYFFENMEELYNTRVNNYNRKFIFFSPFLFPGCAFSDCFGQSHSKRDPGFFAQAPHIINPALAAPLNKFSISLSSSHSFSLFSPTPSPCHFPEAL